MEFLLHSLNIFEFLIRIFSSLFGFLYLSSNHSRRNNNFIFYINIINIFHFIFSKFLYSIHILFSNKFLSFVRSFSASFFNFHFPLHFIFNSS
mmetsp:Transcript_17264/g.1539  ORF Transcript_17264/g.1539 Transcript_17264/m.1539 type:complete len:93 (-) Transcript_17264:852-1130(-)